MALGGGHFAGGCVAYLAAQRQCLSVSGKLKPTFIMGFNIGVFSDQTPNNHDCYHFIDRAFYNFVNSGEQYGDQSILIQAGKYYGLDLYPLLKLVYTWDEVTKDYIRENIQQTDFLLDLVTTFQDKIKSDNSVCNKTEYVWYDSYADMTDEDLQKLIAEVGQGAVQPFLDRLQERVREVRENPNPWYWYFEKGQIVDDLEKLIKSIRCYKGKVVTEIYLTAG